MLKSFEKLLSDVCLEEPIAQGRVRLTPLRLRVGSNLEYRTLAHADKAVTVEETSAAGLRKTARNP